MRYWHPLPSLARSLSRPVVTRKDPHAGRGDLGGPCRVNPKGYRRAISGMVSCSARRGGVCLPCLCPRNGGPRCGAAHPARHDIQYLPLRRACAAAGVYPRLHLCRGHLVERGMAPRMGLGRRLHPADRVACDCNRPDALYSGRRDMVATAGDACRRRRRKRSIGRRLTLAGLAGA